MDDLLRMEFYTVRKLKSLGKNLGFLGGCPSSLPGRGVQVGRLDIASCSDTNCRWGIIR
jgi:hypothetical protein